MNITIRNQHGFAHHLLLLGLIVVIGIASFGAYNLVRPKAATAVASAYIYVAPGGSCSDNMSGASTAAPVCTWTAVDREIGALQSRGAGRGNIYVMFKPGTYDTGTLGNTVQNKTQPGYSLFIVPNWYRYGDTVARGALPQINCAAGSADRNYYGLNVIPRTSAAVNVSFVQINRCSNGISAGGNFSYSCPQNRTDDAYVSKTYITGAKGKPTARVTLQGVIMNQLGNKYIGTPGLEAHQGEAGLNTSNVEQLVVSGSKFYKIENGAPLQRMEHAIYAHSIKKATITKNEFLHISGDPIRVRHDNGVFTLQNNSFYRTGSSALVGEWRINAANAMKFDRCIERASKKPLFKNNKIGKHKTAGKYIGYDGVPIDLWSPYRY